MNIQYASTLHLESAATSQLLATEPLEVVSEVLLLAGDIGQLSDEQFVNHPFWRWVSARYLQVIVAVGATEISNGFDLTQLRDGWIFPIRHNVFYCYNCIVPIENTDIIVSSMWHPTDPNAELDPEFRAQMEREHQRCTRFLQRTVAKSIARNVVVMSNQLPVDNLGDYIASSRINYWIHAEQALKIRRKIGKTCCLTNPMTDSNVPFDRAKIFDIV